MGNRALAVLPPSSSAAVVPAGRVVEAAAVDRAVTAAGVAVRQLP
jgi:hypothetical protein